MIASAYIKDGNIHLYNEGERKYTSVGGVVYELGRPLLDFICYEPQRFDQAFTTMAEAFDNELAYTALDSPDFLEVVSESAGEMQRQGEVYVFFYSRMFYDFIYTFVESPRAAIEELIKQLPNSEKEIRDRLSWAWDVGWPKSSALVTVAHFMDKEKRLFQAAKDVVAIMGESLRQKQGVMIGEVQLLINFRQAVDPAPASSLEYLYWIEEFRRENYGYYFYFENPMRSFYGTTSKPPEVAQMYEIDRIDDLLRFEFVKMIENDVFIKKCKNCGFFFIPRGRPDAEYCSRSYDDSGKRCNEIGAMVQYEKRVAENPILEMHKKAYRRFNSRTRTGKMSQAEFLAWSDEASRKRDECVAGRLPVDEFRAWLEQGRVRKPRGKTH